MFSVEAKQGTARAGKLKTRSGVVDTPFFMPVATRAVGKYIGPDDYNSMNAHAIICNSFVLYLKPGVEKILDLHTFMHYPHTIFTDSGGFQMLRASFLDKPIREGIVFKDPYINKKITLTPALAMQIEMGLMSDVAMALDDVAPYGASRERVEEALDNTHRWAQECKDAHTDEEQLLFGIVQGGFEKDLREKSAKFISSLNFDGIAIGGLAIGEPKEDLYTALTAALPFIPQDKIRYGMGIGSPQDIVKCVGMGVDCFDSIFPAKNARHGTLFTWKGKLDISKGRQSKEEGPIDPECDCFVCKTFSRKYMHHLFKIDEPIGKRYRQYHNLYFMQQLMKKMRVTIQEGTFDNFSKEFLQLYPD